MTRTNQLTSPHLRPPTADLNRLLAGEHHDPHSILGAHEYGDHTVVRGTDPYYQIWFGHRIAYVRAADVRVGPGIS